MTVLMCLVILLVFAAVGGGDGLILAVLCIALANCLAGCSENAVTAGVSGALTALAFLVGLLVGRYGPR